MIRMKEKRRELAAAAYAETTFADVVRHLSLLSFISPVSRLYLTASLVFRCIPVSIYI